MKAANAEWNSSTDVEPAFKPWQHGLKPSCAAGTVRSPRAPLHPCLAQPSPDEGVPTKPCVTKDLLQVPQPWREIHRSNRAPIAWSERTKPLSNFHPRARSAFPSTHIQPSTERPTQTWTLTPPARRSPLAEEKNGGSDDLSPELQIVRGALCGLPTRNGVSKQLPPLAGNPAGAASTGRCRYNAGHLNC